MGCDLFHTLLEVVAEATSLPDYCHTKCTIPSCHTVCSWLTGCSQLCAGHTNMSCPFLYPSISLQLFPGIPPDSRYLARWMVLLVVVLAILTPLSLQHDLHALSFVAVLGVGSVVAFALSCMAVAASAAWQGSLHPLPWFPDWDALAGVTDGGDSADSGNSLWGATRQSDMVMSVARSSAIVFGIIGVVPLLLNADICHQAIFPTMALLRPYNRK